MTKSGWKYSKKGRYNHERMEGVNIQINEKFKLPSGAEADTPGKSGVAGEDINCRCFLSYTVERTKIQKTAVTTKELATDFEPVSATKDSRFVESLNGKPVASSVDSGIIKTSGGKLTLNLQLFGEKDIKRQESNSLKRAIRSYNEKIKEHHEYLKNPIVLCPDWDSKSILEQEGLKRHRNKEIRNFEKSIQDRIDELKERGDYDG